MASGGDALGYYARNIIEDYHDSLFKKLPSSFGLQHLHTSLHQYSTLPDLSKEGSDTDRNNLKVGILGAGVGGLYTALMLDSLNIDYEILEASERAGGRIRTHHFSQDTYDYYDVGAMRYPLPEKENGKYKIGIMKRLGELIDFQGFNPDLSGQRLQDKLIDYIFTADGTYLYYNGIRHKVTLNPLPLPTFRFEEVGVNSAYIHVGVDAIVEDVIGGFAEGLRNDLETQSKEGWSTMMKHDAHSVRSFMSFAYYPCKGLKLPHDHLVTDVVNWCETLDNSTGSYDRALSECVLDALAFSSTGVEWKCFDGGSEVLIDFMKRYIDREQGGTENSHIKYKSLATKISALDDTIKVAIQGKSEVTYSHVISTIPLTGLRMIDLTEASLTVRQSVALRKLEYGPSIKIGMLFDSPWWTELCGIKGGQSYTDLPVRMIVYPSYGAQTPSNVLIASYSWTNDAERMGALIHADKPEVTERLRELVLRDLAKVHDLDYEMLSDSCQAMHAYDWNHDPLTMGAFAQFGPGDFQALYTSLTLPNSTNRLHFAGEALSIRHAWVVGALDSAWRAVLEYLCTSGQEDRIPEFYDKWGKNEEWTQPSSHYNSKIKNNTLLRVHLGLEHLALLSGEERL